MNTGDWFGLNCSPAAMAAGRAGSMRNAAPVALTAVTIKHAMAESTGNSINCLSERRMAKLCLTSCQLRENLPITPSNTNWKRWNCDLGIIWRKGPPVPIVRSMHSQRTGNVCDNGYPASKERTSAKMRVKPRDGAADAVPLVLGLHEHVAFVLVDHELGFDAESFQRVPEFVGLRCGTFAVAVANYDQGGRFHVFDESDGRAFGVDLGIVVN